MVKLKRAAPRKRHRRLLEAKMLAKIGVGTRVAEEAKAKAELLRKSVQAEQENRLSQEAESAQAAVVSQPDRHADLLPAAGGQAAPTLEGFCIPTRAAGSESVATDVAAAAPVAAAPVAAQQEPAERPVATEQPRQHPSSLELVLPTSPGSACDDGSLNERLSLVSHLERFLLVVEHVGLFLASHRHGTEGT